MKNKLNILIVDDDKKIQILLTKILEKEGYYAEKCGNGLEALEILAKAKFHIVITDLKMPGMDGNELLSRMKKMDETIEVILISAHSHRDVDVAIEIMKKGAYDYVTKPFDRVKLLNTVENCAEKYFLKSKNLELKERIAFYEVSQALNSTLDLKELLNIIMKSIQKVIQADQGSIMLLDKKREKLFIKASFGLKEVLATEKDLDYRNGLAGGIIKMGKPQILINGLKEHQLFKKFKSYGQIKSSMVAPLKVKNKTIGLINITRTKIVTQLNQRDLSLLAIFAGHAAKAIENAYLYSKLKDYSTIIKQEKEEIEAIIENISDGIVVSDSSGKITLFNSSFKHLFRLHNNSIIHSLFNNVFHEERFKDLCDFIHDSNDSIHDFTERKFTINIKGENIQLRVTIAKMKTYRNGKGCYNILTFQDLTKLVQAQKVAAWQGMARSLAHEVKNPLTPILWAAEAILEKKSKYSEQFIENKCNTIINEVNRLKNLISEFSSFAKHPEPDLKPGSIEEVLKETLLLYSNLSNIKITTNFPDKFPIVKIDKKMIKQVFINLIQNAIDAMPNGGELSINGEVLSIGVVSLIFQDTGKGIPEEIVDHLFDPYFTTKKNGTGLGLTITSKIISDHQGQIKVISNKNQGATIVIDLLVL